MAWIINIILIWLFNSPRQVPAAHSIGIKRSSLSEALAFCRRQKLDTSLAIFVDMSIPSGRRRLFLTELHSGNIRSAALCCHGMGGGSTEERPVFSNKPNSNCTSLGKYKTGERAYSRYGIHVHYKLHGLEASNNMAFSRTVVLHSFSPVPDREVHPEYLPMGWSLGCPVTSDRMMTTLDSLLRKTKRPLLLWIYQ